MQKADYMALGFRDYQAECLEALEMARSRSKSRALVVLASGLGKTRIALYDACQVLNSLEGRTGRELFLCNREELILQALEVFKELWGDKYSYGLFTGKEKVTAPTDFLFATMQSMYEHLPDFAADSFDYVIVDEAHHAMAPTYREVIEHFRPRFRLGMTATPERMDGLALEEVFGERVFELDVFAGIALGWLAEVVYRIISEHDLLEFQRYLKRHKDVSEDVINAKFFADKLDREIIKTIQRQSEKFVEKPRIMIFCGGIAHAERIAAHYPGAACVYSKKAAKENRKAIDDYRQGKITTLVSVGMLNEGFDVPATDVVVFLHDPGSLTVFFQQFGRGLRREERKDKLLVLDFAMSCMRMELVLSMMEQIRERSLRMAAKVGMTLEYATMNDETVRGMIMPKQRKSKPRRRRMKFKIEDYDIRRLQDVPQRKVLKLYTRQEIADLTREAEKLKLDLPAKVPCVAVYVDMAGGGFEQAIIMAKNAASTGE